MNPPPEAFSDYDLDVLIIGAGFSGIYQLYKCRLLNLRAKIFEAGSDLGGVWYWNCYPGARVDVPVPSYEFTLREIWEDWWWTERYPGQEEIRAYFAHVEKKLDIKKDCMLRMDYSAIKVSGNMPRFRFQAVYSRHPQPLLVPWILWCTSHCAMAARGCGHQGQTCRGYWHWCLGVQIVQTLSKTAQKMTVFQRTPNLAMPMRQTRLDRETQDKEKHLYPILHRRKRQTAEILRCFAGRTPPAPRGLWKTGGFSYIFENFNDVLTNRAANEEVYAFWRDKVRERIKDAELREKLAPNIPIHAMGAKRSSLEMDYYDVYNQSNVELVDVNSNSIVEITPNGIRTEDGREHELDLLVLATGFDSVTGGITNINIVGTDGISIKEKWKDGIHTYLGLGCAGFPNLFFVHGPQSPTAVCIGPTCSVSIGISSSSELSRSGAQETEGDWIAECIRVMTTNNLARIEPTREAEIGWREEVMKEASTRLINTAKSWYRGANVPGNPFNHPEPSESELIFAM
ncbi:hypothetical protein D9757_010118 [Collybiopsis confluens]|uniref:FAD/NAD(P)-binding domain-containing protein n=1 Tax=Collybiopsis confluens TaxID=2823264 RepID=A0A8H5GLN9_9AGAR|nr:hypothetical protein D9757_010118 [Collybiopsis confluens]